MELEIKAVPATRDIMIMLEAKGIIRRLAPGCDQKQVRPGINHVETLYRTHTAYGSHKMIAVTVNSDRLKQLTAHPDKEDFLLIGDSETAQLILTIALHKKDVLERKIADKTLRADDFIAMLCKMNDPELSFFTMNPEFPHGETCQCVSDNPPSFYVSEPSDLPELHIDLNPYSIKLKEALV